MSIRDIDFSQYEGILHGVLARDVNNVYMGNISHNRLINVLEAVYLL